MDTNKKVVLDYLNNMIKELEGKLDIAKNRRNGELKYYLENELDGLYITKNLIEGR